MRKIFYSIELAKPDGEVYTTLPGLTYLTWTRTVNAKGSFTLQATPQQFPRAFFGLDHQVYLWRKVVGFKPQLVFMGLMQARQSDSRGGNRLITVKGPDLIDLLDTRIIDAAAGSSGADKSDKADDVMKQYVRENLGATAAAGRTLSAYLDVQADIAAGPDYQKKASRDNLLKTLQDIGAGAAAKGTPVYFDITLGAKLLFETFVGQRGADLRAEQALSEENGALANVVFEEDWRGEVTYVYAGGTGTEAARTVVQVQDTTRSGASPFRRRELFHNGSMEGSGASLTDAGYQRLRQGRPRRRLEADIVNHSQFQYGVHWNFGDRRLAKHEGEEYPVEVASVTGTVGRRGQESIEARLSYADE